jgi:HSP90 family molecular chaperone
VHGAAAGLQELRADGRSAARAAEVRAALGPQYFRNILTRYSNFINFPVHLNGTRINTIDAIWTRDKSAISDEDHLKFFQVPFPFLNVKR